MIKQFSFLFLTTLVFNTSVAQEKDYSELKFVYSDLVEAFKSENDENLRDFCYALATDKKTIEYMRKNWLCYRGIPCKMDDKGIGIKAIGDEFFPNLLRVRNMLKNSGLLDSLSHIDSTQYKWDIEIFINKWVEGYSKPINQDHYSISMEQYKQAQKMADSLQKPVNEILLNGNKGDVIIVYGTEMSMMLKSGSKTIQYPIGEMVLINNKWSLFTRPSVDYYLKEEE